MNNNRPVRVRFAPSPTGGLHLGGIRTVLYNYLFAKKYNGTFVLRIEDTDQTRYVAGAETYINNTLTWCGLTPDEGVQQGGTYGPYKQSERKAAGIYKQYATQLVEQGYAYYAFDTPADLEQMRIQHKTAQNPTPQYDKKTRGFMKNALSLSKEEVDQLLAKNTPYVIRIKMPENETVHFNDIIRGDIQFDTNIVDDKVLLKADGMPTYHLAVVVDDYLMKISHAFRGEEWLPSAPVHILLWQYLGWQYDMPQWAHLPLILGPNGKLSKRDGAKYGFPVFGLNWLDPNTNELTEGFKEKGFLPEAFVNMLAMLGWNDGTEKEIFSLQELIHTFSLERVHSAGAKFDYEKALWFNTEWIKKLTPQVLLPYVKAVFAKHNTQTTDAQLLDIIPLIQDRCHLLTDFYTQGIYFIEAPKNWDIDAIKTKWNEAKTTFFNGLIQLYQDSNVWDSATLETICKALATTQQIKPSDVLMPLRIMLVGGKFGPQVFDIAQRIGKNETIHRIQHVLQILHA
jgi:glutamyl-tRNA synthetase